jgi:hypothetical protein
MARAGRDHEQRGGQRVVEVELLYDRDNTTERYYRTRGGRPEPMFETGTAPIDVVTALPPIRGEPRLAGAFPDSLPERPPRPAA